LQQERNPWINVIVLIFNVMLMSLVIVTRMESIVQIVNLVSNSSKLPIIVKIVKLEPMAQLKVLELLANHVQMVSFKKGLVKHFVTSVLRAKLELVVEVKIFSRQRARNAQVTLFQERMD
jgi:hypothetical protein